MSRIDKSACHHATTTSLIAFAQTAIGCGIGLLLSGKLGRGAQKTTAFTMLAIGAAATAPVIYEVIEKCVNRPESARGMRRRLQSIRDDAGFAEESAY